jgi:hypothetical protein
MEMETKASQVYRHKSHMFSFICATKTWNINISINAYRLFMYTCTCIHKEKKHDCNNGFDWGDRKAGDRKKMIESE